MRTLAVLAVAFLASSPVLGCGPGGSRGGAQSSLDGYRVPQSMKDDIRAKDKAENAKKEADEDDALDEREKAALKALNQALGKSSAHRGRVPESSSTVVLALRKTPIKVRLEPITDDDGKSVSDDLLTIKDSYTDRVTALQQKLVEQRASKAEIKEIQDGSKYMMKVGDLRMEVSDISSKTFDANLHLQMDGLQTMLKVSMLIGHRKMMEMELDDEDYATVRRSLERLRRAEAIAASTMGMLAAYVAVLNSNGDPKALDSLAGSSVSAFPLKPTVTDNEAKQYVANMKGNIATQKQKYERMMRRTYGDAKYERKHKASVDAIFAQAEAMQNQKSSRQIMQEKLAARDARAAGADGAAAGTDAPASDARMNASGTAASTPASGSASTPASASVSGASAGGVNAARIAQGAGVANSVGAGDVSGALDGAAKMFPSDGTIGSSLAGLSALSKGDARGAIDAAMNLVPGGGLIKDGLSFAANLLFGSGKKS